MNQTFAVHAPAATSVLLAADFTHWQRQPISLRKRSGGDWTTTVGLPPGTYRYRFLVDGEWSDDSDWVLRLQSPAYA